MAKKFNFKQAIPDTLSAVGGGYMASQVVKLVEENVPDMADKAVFAPVALGFFLSQNKNKMAAAAGLGMIGASAENLLASFGINGAGVGRSKMKLSPAQRREMMKNAQRSLRVAQAPNKDILAGAMEYAENNY